MTERTHETCIINEDRASTVLERVSDPTVRNLVSLAVANARKRFIRWESQTEHEWRSSLPESDFDMAFFVEVMVETFSKRDLVEKLLAGASPEEASGWSIK